MADSGEPFEHGEKSIGTPGSVLSSLRENSFKYSPILAAVSSGGFYFSVMSPVTFGK